MDVASAAQFRAQAPVTRQWAYFDHAAVAPLPSPAARAIEDWLRQASEAGDVHWPAWSRRIEELRQSAAAMVNANPDEIALVPNTSVGIGLIAEGLSWQSGDNVVTAANEFPSNLYPWLNLAERGVETRRVEAVNGVVSLTSIEAAIDERTRIVSLSWVGYASGYRIDPAAVGALCRRKGCLFFLDAIQGLGVFPLDVSSAEVDFFAADGHKWLLGPEGAGLLYVRRERLNNLRPLMIGWNSTEQRGAFDDPTFRIRPTAARYESGTLNTPGFLGLAASVDLLRAWGVGPQSSLVAERVLQVTDYAIERLRSAGAEILSPRVPGCESGIVVFRCGEQPAADVRKQLLAAGIVVSCRGGGIRISPHAYNTAEEIDRLIGALRT